MDDIESGKQKMRGYFAEQRERQKRSIKVNIPNHQELKQEDVASPSQPIIIRQYQPQPQQPIVINEPVHKTQEKVRFSYPAFGFSMLLVGITIAYLAYTESQFAVMLKPFFADPLMILLAIVFFIGCIAMMCVRK